MIRLLVTDVYKSSDNFTYVVIDEHTDDGPTDQTQLDVLLLSPVLAPKVGDEFFQVIKPLVFDGGRIRTVIWQHSDGRYFMGGNNLREETLKEEPSLIDVTLDA